MKPKIQKENIECCCFFFFVFLFCFLLFKKNNYTSQPIQSPCFHIGTTETVNVNRILNSPCANGLLFSYPKAIDLNLLSQRQAYAIVGTSEAQKCEREFDALLPDTKCNYGNNMCSFNEAFLPPIGNTRFYVYSFYFIF